MGNIYTDKGWHQLDFVVRHSTIIGFYTLERLFWIPIKSAILATFFHWNNNMSGLYLVHIYNGQGKKGTIGVSCDFLALKGLTFTV